MFTGLVEEKGRLLSFARVGEGTNGGWHLTLAAKRVLSDAALGDSIAVNGCCLTVVAIDREAGTLTFDVLEETRRLTNFAALSEERQGQGRAGGMLSSALAGEPPPVDVRSGAQASRAPAQHLNLERSLRADARLGGHFVSGHIDGVGTVESLAQHGADYRLRVRLPENSAQRGPLVNKGSIAIDGVSLTVAEVDADGLTVWLIPTTLAETNLGEKQPGDPVNLEYDLLGKYVQQIVGAQVSSHEQAELAALDGV